MIAPRIAAPLLALALLPACILPVPVPEGTPGAFELVIEPGDSCGARGLQEFVGRSEAAVLATTFTAPIRVIRPDEAVTEEFIPERANFRTDASGTIVAVDCG